MLNGAGDVFSQRKGANPASDWIFNTGRQRRAAVVGSPRLFSVAGGSLNSQDTLPEALDLDGTPILSALREFGIVFTHHSLSSPGAAQGASGAGDAKGSGAANGSAGAEAATEAGAANGSAGTGRVAAGAAGAGAANGSAGTEAATEAGRVAAGAGAANGSAGAEAATGAAV